MYVPRARSRAFQGFNLRGELTDSPPGTEQTPGDVTECHTHCARFRRRGDWEGFTEIFGCTKGANDGGGKVGRTRQAALETGTDTRTRNKKSKNRSQTPNTQNNSRSSVTPMDARSWAKNEANSRRIVSRVGAGSTALARFSTRRNSFRAR